MREFLEDVGELVSVGREKPGCGGFATDGDREDLWGGSDSFQRLEHALVAPVVPGAEIKIRDYTVPASKLV